MTDLTQPVTAADFVTAGASPEQAAILVEQHESLAGRRGPDARAALQVAAQDHAPPPAPVTASTVTQAEAVSALEAHEAAILQGHMDKLYEPPPSARDYRIPPSFGGQPTDEALAADTALTDMLYAERTPRDLGEAIMKDIAARRPTEKSAEAAAALRPWLDQRLRKAQANPALRPYVEGASAEQLLAVLSPETVVALSPFVNHRAGNRR
jgi:hypothetical protein